MSRRRRAEESSLELLLDTITNTFGGILFLAILVSLLLRTSPPSAERQNGPPSQVMSAAEHAEMEVKLEDVKDRVARLQRHAAGEVARTPQAGLAPEDRVAALESTLVSLLEERARVGLETAELQRTAVAAAADAAKIAERALTAAQRYADAQRNRDAATAEAQQLEGLRRIVERSEEPTVIEQTAGMPTLRDTDKQQVGIYVRFGKLFLMHSWRDGVRHGPNPDYFVVSPGRPPVARPKPDAGISVMAGTIDAEVARLLREFPPAEWVVAVVVCADSFDAFQLVKRAVVKADYEYNPIPLKPGGAVFDSGGDSQAQ
jgi:hypothetical protein